MTYWQGASSLGISVPVNFMKVLPDALSPGLASRVGGEKPPVLACIAPARFAACMHNEFFSQGDHAARDIIQ